MKLFISLMLILISPVLLYSQHGFHDPLLAVRSKDSVYGEPQLYSSLGTYMKLNGYYDAFGGLQDYDTFNVGFIDVFGTDDSNSFKMDMYDKFWIYV